MITFLIVITFLLLIGVTIYSHRGRLSDEETYSLIRKETTGVVKVDRYHTNEIVHITQFGHRLTVVIKDKRVVRHHVFDNNAHLNWTLYDFLVYVRADNDL